jgi:hypothetical protein
MGNRDDVQVEYVAVCIERIDIATLSVIDTQAINQKVQDHANIL